MNQNHHHQQQQSNEVRHDDDSTLTEFLASLTDYTPTIPDELVEHYLAKSGFQCPDVRLTRLVAVAAQKFVSDIATDALHIKLELDAHNWYDFGSELNCKWDAIIQEECHCKARQAAGVRDKKDKQQRDKRPVMNMEDLSKALQEYGVNVKHQEYFADNPSAGLESTSRDE